MHPAPEHSEPIGLEDLRNLIGELRMLARALLQKESKPHSLTPTGLAMTALRRAKLEEQNWDEVRWENRAHFFSAVSRAMRNALIDHARRRRARGRENIIYLPPDEILFCDLAGDAEENPMRIIALEEALTKLDAVDKRLAEVIHHFYFLGYSTAEIARSNDVSDRTVDRDLKRARLLLRKLMEGAGDKRAA